MAGGARTGRDEDHMLPFLENLGRNHVKRIGMFTTMALLAAAAAAIAATEPGPAAPPGGAGVPQWRDGGGRMRGRGFHRGAGMRHGGGAWGRGPGGRAFEQLDLSASQRRQIDEIRNRTQRDAIQRRAEMETASLDLRELMRDDRPDRRAIDRQIDRIAELRADMMKARVASQLDMRAVLTDEQRDRLHELRDSGRGMQPGWPGIEPKGSSSDSGTREDS
jgi:Spy/CpxP family protein refolding chaperone